MYLILDQDGNTYFTTQDTAVWKEKIIGESVRLFGIDGGIMKECVWNGDDLVWVELEEINLD